MRQRGTANLLVCLCGDGKPKILKTHLGRTIFGQDRLLKPWAGKELPGARSRRRDRRKRHDRPFADQIPRFSPPSWSSYTWIGYR
jgi:hypothetical protein